MKIYIVMFKDESYIKLSEEEGKKLQDSLLASDIKWFRANERLYATHLIKEVYPEMYDGQAISEKLDRL